MSAKHKRSSYNAYIDDVFEEEICPEYDKYDKRARRDSIARIMQHLSERRDGIQKCVEIAVEDAYKLRSHVAMHNSAPQFIDDDTIIRLASTQTNIQINKWDGVKIKQCKKEMIDSFEKFAKKAKNHQDQTSWKISGDYFFAPYIKKAKIFLYNLCENIMGINDEMRIEMQYLLCLSFANALFNEEIKFRRTKPKPLIRHRTLVKSNGIHSALEALHPVLTVSQRINDAKLKRKQTTGRSNVIAKDFFNSLKEHINKHYIQQKRKVYTLLKINDDGDDDIDIDIECSDTASYTAPLIEERKRKQRQFQAVPMRNVSENKKRNRIINIKKKEIRKQKIEKQCEFVLKHYNETDIHSTHSLSDFPVINAVNNVDGCSDCINTNSMPSFFDDATVSTTTPPVPISPHINDYLPPPPPPHPQRRYNDYNYGIFVDTAINDAHQVRILQRKNMELSRRILHVKSIIRQRRMLLCNMHMRSPYPYPYSYPHPHHHPPPRVQHVQQQYTHNHNHNQGYREEEKEIDVTDDNNMQQVDEHMLFPDGTMLNERAPFNGNESTLPMFNLQSVEPFPLYNNDSNHSMPMPMPFLPKQTTLSPDATFDLQSSFHDNLI